MKNEKVPNLLEGREPHVAKRLASANARNARAAAKRAGDRADRLLDKATQWDIQAGEADRQMQRDTRMQTIIQRELAIGVFDEYFGGLAKWMTDDPPRQTFHARWIFPEQGALSEDAYDACGKGRPVADLIGIVYEDGDATIGYTMYDAEGNRADPIVWSPGLPIAPTTEEELVAAINKLLEDHGVAVKPESAG